MALQRTPSRASRSRWTQHGRSRRPCAAGKYLQLAAAVCLIDSVVFPPDAFLAELRRLGEQLATTNYTEVLQRAAASLFIEKDDPERKTRLLAKMAKTP